MNGNIGLVFDDNPDDMQYVYYKDYVPTAYAVANRTTDTAGVMYTTNPNESVVQWVKGAKPSTNVSVVNFTAQGMLDPQHQLITFEVISKENSACVGYGRWILKLDCNNCPCTVPTFIRNKDGSITVNDGYGLVFTIRPDNCGGLITVPTPTCSTEPPLDPEDTTVCGIEEMQGAMLKVNVWQRCNNGVPVGVYFYNGMLYINTLAGNMKSPTSRNSAWMGGYDFYELIQAMVQMFTAEVITNVRKELEAFKLEVETGFNTLKSDLAKVLTCSG